MKTSIVFRNLLSAIPASVLVFLLYGYLTTMRLVSVGLFFGESPEHFRIVSLLVYALLGTITGAGFWIIDSIFLGIFRKDARFKSDWGGFSFYFLSSVLFLFSIALFLKIRLDWLLPIKRVPLVKPGTAIIFAVVLFLLYLFMRTRTNRLIGDSSWAFAGRVFLPLAVAVYILFISGYTGPGPVEQAASDVPRVILITIDTLRADFLGCYGMDTIRTPNIDKVAGDGILFDKAYSQAPYTWPSLTCFLTGLYTVRHSVRMNYWKMDEDIETFPSILSATGNHTAGISDLGIGEFGIGQAFDEILERDRNIAELQPFRRFFRWVPTFSGWFNGGSDSSLPITLVADKWLINNATKQGWFLWIHYYNDAPHSPYFSPEPYCSLYLPEGYDGEIDGSIDQIMDLSTSRKSLSEEDVEALKALYMGEVTWVDRQIGVLIDRLKAQGVYDATTIIINSDHGQMFGRDGNYQHGFYLYDSLLRVPLIIKSPDTPEYLRGSKVKKLVRLVDIFPTLCGIFGIEEESVPEGDGKSLMTFIKRGEDPSFNEWNYAETLKYANHDPSVRKEALTFGFCAVNNQGWKVIGVPEKGMNLLYNTVEEEEEMTNRIDSMPDMAASLIDSVSICFGIESVEYLIPDKPHELSEESEEMLRTLGYIE